MRKEFTTPGGEERLQSATARQSPPYPPGDGKVKLVTTDWLEDHLQERGMTVLDVQPNVHDYIKEHVPGAIYLNEGFLRVPAHGFPTSYGPQACMQESFRRVGLAADSPVVVYTGKGAFSGIGDGLAQTMMAYSLAKFGHNTVYVLDGGIDKWKDEGRTLSQEFPAVDPSQFTVEVRGEYPIGYEDFKQVKDRDDVVVLDARPAKVYEGQGPWRKPGHIPGAISLPWRSLMDDGNPMLLKPNDAVIDILEQHNIDRSKTIICSCGTGREATNEFLLFKWYFEYPDVRLYEGSYTEWTAYPENETVEGREARKKPVAAAPSR
ncbi:sulfurtransferase [Methanoculleus sp. FWC-SCC1]|uniref:Sulfurtransferase n=1 Tax=Methanoculleus frigidifontis TaxID=2584085 RepID=A0ABT8M7H3_9EURY|nr:sulfurtransferase [Methanoculleus sp. FWC-SCC1]MDN7023882.1 sulfurtransferase [Methanoculleus sp. FWC-SCC1]